MLHMLLPQMANYNVTLIYIVGNVNVVGDVLSTVKLQRGEGPDLQDYVIDCINIHGIIVRVPASSINLYDYMGATQQKHTISLFVKQSLFLVWPECRVNCQEEPLTLLELLR